MHHHECWWLACVLQIDLEEHKIKVSILYPNGPACSFKFPNILWISMSDVLHIVDPRLNSYIYGNTERKPNCHRETLHNHDEEVK